MLCDLSVLAIEKADPEVIKKKIHAQPNCALNLSCWYRGFVFAIFQGTTAYKIESEHTRGYRK